MTTRFERYFQIQMENPQVRDLVEKELASLEVGTQIAKLRERKKLNQTQLAARANMSTPKISRIESKPTNVQLDTLIRIARALGARLEVRLVEYKRNRRARFVATGAR
ncbi:MAG TPA: helix-turn-helix transcriptional regulator [Terriglobales bacterium]|nr:helix-turn-helix transcriptional regulator [Terriglobales bacterium]